MKFCTKCKVLKSFDNFYRDKTTKDGFHPHCKSHKRKSADPKIKSEYDKNYRQKNNIRKKANAYKITQEELLVLIKNCNNLCCICKKPETAINPKTKKIQALAIDHCHVTGKVRGLLCANCNRALGLFKDDIQTLKNAIAYLEQNI